MSRGLFGGGMELNPLNVRGRNGTRNKYQKRGGGYCLEDREGRGQCRPPMTFKGEKFHISILTQNIPRFIFYRIC